ncbi:MAG: alanine--tRNA ligase [Firmicutes bacterium]|nr:alanine--tRNA ligase [Bacillota bacterium]
MITSKELRKKWLDFYEKRGHVNIGAVSLLGDGTTGVMFNVAGMQPLMPYLLGKPHPAGKRLCNVQGCIRTIDIDDIGDESHCSFFELMGNWSLGDYFKKEKTAWTFEFLTKELGFDKNKICATVFAGDENAPRDEETAKLLEEVGVKKENIFYLPKKDNWWELEGTTNTPCGPDNEWFYPRHDNPCSDHCDVTCDCGRWVEIGNDVYMQYKKLEGNKYVELENKNVDTGFGFERLLMYVNGLTDIYKTDLFADVISYLQNESGKDYENDFEARKAMRIIADHIRTSVMLIGDKNGIVPSNVGAGYILRRLMRRAIRYARQLNLSEEALNNVAKIYIEKIYNEAYPLLLEKEEYILSEISKEVLKFSKVVDDGIKEFEKVIGGLERKNQFMSQKDANFVEDRTITGKAAFRLYDTFGFPIEMTKELAREKGYIVDEEGFNEAFKHHQEISKQSEKGEFKGGLADSSYQSTRLHTATHLLLAALRKKFGSDVHQCGSNITPERLRFDFNVDRKLTPEELLEIENEVNNNIQRAIDVEFYELPIDEAKQMGATGIFDDKYGDIVKVYKIGDVSIEMCGGPHVKNTSELNKFKIVKEESSSAGVRRIKAILE